MTILPLNLDTSKEDIREIPQLLPLVGAIIGAIISIAGWALLKIFPPDIASLFLIAIYILITGGFHIDGLSDTFDALGIKPSGDPQSDIEKRLSVMKEPSAGPMGVLSIIFVVFFKYLSIKYILERGLLGVIFLLPMFSRWAVLSTIKNGNPARKDGLGSIFIGKTGIKPVSIITLISVSIFSALALKVDIWLISLGISLPYLFGHISTGFLRKRFGGITGDHLGAIIELSEILFLLLAVIWLQLYI
jgi:adenosylcobinamide-GDP ribazoletransferase